MMKTLNWRHTDRNARNFIFSIGQDIIGQLSFYSFFKLDAIYTDRETKLKFSQKSFWDRDVLITKDGQSIGKIENDFLFGKQTLKLPTGEIFILSSNFWGRDVNWKTEKGETIVKYQQATMNSMGKGLVSLNESLTIETEKLLVSSGLFARQLLHKRIALIVVMMIPILAASRR